MIKHNHIIFDLGHVIFDYDPDSDIKKITPANVFSLMPGAYELLQDCHNYRDHTGQRPYRLSVLSNATVESLRILHTYFPHILSLFDTIMTSGEIGMAKPDARIYHHFLQTHQLRPEECIFIDDKEANTRAAQAIGIHSIQYTDINTLRKTFKSLFLL